jgi:hypothetical protein
MNSAPQPNRSQLPVGTRQVTLATGVSFHLGLLFLSPEVGIGMMLFEGGLYAIIILTALYASSHFSDRAFRILPWTAQAASQCSADASKKIKRRVAAKLGA